MWWLFMGLIDIWRVIKERGANPSLFFYDLVWFGIAVAVLLFTRVGPWDGKFFRETGSSAGIVQKRDVNILLVTGDSDWWIRFSIDSRPVACPKNENVENKNLRTFGVPRPPPFEWIYSSHYRVNPYYRVRRKSINIMSIYTFHVKNSLN